MTTTLRWVLWLVPAVCAAALAPALLADPALLSRLSWHGADPLWTVWLPAVAGIVLSWAIVTRRQRDEMADRVGEALANHPLGTEVRWLLFFLVCFVAGAPALSHLLGAAFPPEAYVTAVPVVRVFFLFVLPVLVVDRAGINSVGAAMAMPALAMRVGEPWRWGGLLPVVVCVGLVVVGVRGTPMPSPGTVAFTMLVTFVAITVPEEIFYRGMVQSRLERLAGRWPAIAAASFLFAVAHAVMDPYNEIVDLSSDGPLHRLGVAIPTYGVLGVLLGYVWSQYRNIWLLVLLRGTMLTLIIAPTVRIVE
ncbi:CPBP family intramembrane glutamic endopeptidase [Halostreptopolyspora alba]|uniref:CPBP family intramembrane metalloprotease n=1 Tax=Halostreptopolyspora alba TaxID=2487137 RepID=A0A3N0E7U2_9ACTN|nr:CPBP family intramembrane metalloprotease [Nocardiopsaceae bacterium YIM 96095]